MPFAGEKIKASDIPDRFGCTLRRAAVQSIPDNVLTTISWDTQDEDLDNFISIPGTTITIPVGGSGIYSITIRVLANALNSTRNFHQIVPTSVITGTPPEFRDTLDIVEERGLISILVPLEAGDSFIYQVFQDNAAATAIDYTAWLSGYRTSF